MNNFILRKSETLDSPKFKYRITNEEEFICNIASDTDAVAAVVYTDLQKLNANPKGNYSTVYRLFKTYELDAECIELLQKNEYDLAVLQDTSERTTLSQLQKNPNLSEGEHGTVKKRTDNVIVRLYNDTVEDGAPYPNMVTVLKKIKIAGKTDWYLVDVYQAGERSYHVEPFTGYGKK